jgi:hypothetical protein
MFVYSCKLGDAFGIFENVRLEEVAVCFCGFRVYRWTLRVQLEGGLVKLQGLFNLDYSSDEEMALCQLTNVPVILLCYRPHRQSGHRVRC